MSAAKQLNHYPTLAALFTDGVVPTSHTVHNALTSLRPVAGEWLDHLSAIVSRLEGFAAMTSQVPAWQKIKSRLAVPSEFAGALAECESLATVIRNGASPQLADPSLTTRAADFVLPGEPDVHVEVRIVQDAEDDQGIRDSAHRVEKRVDLPMGCLAVISVWRPLDSKEEKALAEGMKRALQPGAPTTPVVLSLQPAAKVVTVTGRTSRYAEAASAELRPITGTRGFMFMYGHMAEPEERVRIRGAISKKRNRKQRDPTKPWVLVLDVTPSSLWLAAEMNSGADAEFKTSASCSAVVIRQTKLASESGGLRCRASVIMNGKARNPVDPTAIEKLFAEDGPLESGV